MNLEKSFEQRFGRFPLSNITYYLIIGQVISFILIHVFPWIEPLLLLRGYLVLTGQWWRLFTMLFMPLSLSPVWVVLDWYLMYIFGAALEQTWGAFYYAVYVLLAYCMTVVGALLFPSIPFGNGYIFGSIFLAFAYLYPDFRLMIFFIIPVKVKWLGWLAWIGMIGSFVFGDMTARLLSGVATLNFFLFFGKSLALVLQDRVRGISHKTKVFRDNQKTYMRCATCGETEQSDKIFYYCHTCVPDTCYCEDHIKTHAHKK